jgi:hypothetical protein
MRARRDQLCAARENTFVVQTKEKLKATPYVSAWGIAGPAFWRGAVAEGVHQHHGHIDGPQPPERTAFINEYRRRHNRIWTLQPRSKSRRDLPVQEVRRRRRSTEDPRRARTSWSSRAW